MKKIIARVLYINYTLVYLHRTKTISMENNCKKVCNKWLENRNYQEVKKQIGKLKEAGYIFEVEILPGNLIGSRITHPSLNDRILLRSYKNNLYVSCNNDSKLLLQMAKYLKEN